MFSLLISGPKQTENGIHVSLEPLLNGIKVTWDEWVRTYDSHTRSLLNMKSILMWVIHEFIAYRSMSGCMDKGFMHVPYVEGK